jgi:hypothetical protein
MLVAKPPAFLFLSRRQSRCLKFAYRYQLKHPSQKVVGLAFHPLVTTQMWGGLSDKMKGCPDLHVFSIHKGRHYKLAAGFHNRQNAREWFEQSVLLGLDPEEIVGYKYTPAAQLTRKELRAYLCKHTRSRRSPQVPKPRVSNPHPKASDSLRAEDGRSVRLAIAAAEDNAGPVEDLLLDDAGDCREPGVETEPG